MRRFTACAAPLLGGLLLASASAAGSTGTSSRPSVAAAILHFLTDGAALFLVDFAVLVFIEPLGHPLAELFSTGTA